jgi:hypothetical protein
MGRRSAVTTVSLFSFQDIITSTTAILILIMLLLALQLSQRQQAAAVSDLGATVRTLDKMAEEQAAIVAHLRKQLAAAQAAAGERRPREEYEQAARDATARLDRVRLEREDAEQLARLAERRRLESEARLAAREADRELVDKSARQLAEDSVTADRLDRENAAEKQRQAKRRQEMDERPSSGTELVFNRPQDSAQRPWLVELSGNGVVVVQLGTNAPEPLGASWAAGSPLAAWCERLHPAGDYCLLLMRPSAAPEFLDAVETRLKEAGISYGIDFIGENQTVRDGTSPSGTPGPGKEKPDGP